MNKTAVLILAAGASSRLGRPKQLLPFQGQILVQRIVDTAVAASAGQVIVVTGAYADDVRQALAGTTASVVHNDRWEEGMASSIRTGIAALSIETRKAIICVCDQPFVTPGLFIRMVKAGEETGKGIIASSYADTIGVPVLFHSRYFYQLAMLHAREGAKGFISRFPEDVAIVPFPDGEKDIDTEGDYNRLLEEG